MSAALLTEIAFTSLSLSNTLNLSPRLAHPQSHNFNRRYSWRFLKPVPMIVKYGFYPSICKLVRKGLHFKRALIYKHCSHSALALSPSFYYNSARQ
jgi:hypothetical protein